MKFEVLLSSSSMHLQAPCSSFFKLLLVAFFFLFSCGLFNSTFNAAAKDNPCGTIANKSNIQGVEEIKCIGRLKKGLLVVTTKMEVWQLDDDALGQQSIDSTINQLYFGNKPPVPIEKKWPKLVTDKRYLDIKSDIPTCRVMIDDDTEWLLLDSSWRQDKGGMRWDINNQFSDWGFMNIHRDNDTKFLSSNGIAKFYTITNAPGHLMIVQYSACNTPNADRRGAGRMVSRMAEANGCGEVTSPGNCFITGDPHFRPVCKDGATKVRVGKLDEKCDFINWPVFTGFIDNGQFYFFGKDSVFNLPEDAYTGSASSTIKTIPYDNFIKCEVNPHPIPRNNNKKALTIGIIIALVLLLLICCLCVMLCLVREAMARRKRKKGKKGKHGKEPEAEPLIPFGPAGVSRRSTALVSPRKLSKKASSLSKRSRGGLSPGRKLSKKRASSQQTRRSKMGASRKGGSLSRGVSPAGGKTRRSKAGASMASTKRSRGAGSSASVNRQTKHSAAHNAVSNKATARSKLKHR